MIHECIRDHHGNIEVTEVAFLGFAFDELHDVRVPDIQNTHICPTSSAALFDDIGRGIEHPHKGDRAGCHAIRRTDGGTFRPQVGKVIAGSSSRLVNDRSPADRIKNLRERIIHRQRETG